MKLLYCRPSPSAHRLHCLATLASLEGRCISRRRLISHWCFDCVLRRYSVGSGKVSYSGSGWRHCSHIGRYSCEWFPRHPIGCMPLKFQSPGWSEFQTGATTLALHLGRARGGGEGRASAEPAAGTCAIGFSVEDLEATHRELTARGARFVLAPTEQVNEGIRLAACTDPDGLSISFAEPLTREPPRGE